MRSRIHIPKDQIAELCRRWKISELSIFGSVLGDDFRNDSDVDVLIQLEPNHGWGWEIFDLQAELTSLLGRKVDLVFKDGLRNPIRRRHIMNSRQVLYAA
jgi:uncharacterized protein